MQYLTVKWLYVHLCMVDSGGLVFVEDPITVQGRRFQCQAVQLLQLVTAVK